MRTFVRYLSFQIPEWLILALFLWLLARKTPVNFWLAAGFFVFWVVKDLAIYPLVRDAFEKNAKTGTEQLIGRKGVTHETLAPEGYIKIRGELWKARAEDQPIPRDTIVNVTAATGMTLTVRAEDGRT